MRRSKTAWVERPTGRQVGTFHVDFEVANNYDMSLAEHGDLRPEKVRRIVVRGFVDTRVTTLVLPESVGKQLGLQPTGKVKVKYSDGRTTLRDEVMGVFVNIQGRDGLFSAVLEPKRDTALIGLVILEDLDFLVDNKQQRLVPRDPDFVMHEIE